MGKYIANIFNKDIILNNSTPNNNGCWVWKRPLMSNGYGQIRIEYKMWKSHRLAYTLYKGTIPKGLYVCHSCDIKECVNPDHLWLGTAKDNTVDAKNKGLMSSGENHYRGHNSDKLIAKIRSEHQRKYGENVRLGKKYGIPASTISKYVNNISR